MTVPRDLRGAMRAVRTGRPMFGPEARYAIRRGKTFIHAGDAVRSADLRVIWFRTRGCTFDWAGQCTMCNYGVGADVSASDMAAFVREALDQEPEYDALYVSPSGSLLDPREVPPAALQEILSAIASFHSNTFSCESRPEFINKASLELLMASLPDRRLAINVGVESADDYVRFQLLAKSTTTEAIQRSFDLLNEAGVRPIANVLLGAPSLTEKEALDDAVRSGRWAIENGAGLVILFPANLKRWTSYERLHAAGLWKPPSLWSLVEAIWEISGGNSARVGLSWFDAPVSEIVLGRPTTCEACRPHVARVLHDYQATGDIRLISDLRSYDCDCHTAWRKLITHEPSSTLEERRAAMIQALSA